MPTCDEARIPYPLPYMRTNRREQSPEAESTAKIEAIRAAFDKENTFGALSDHKVITGNPAREEHPMCTERKVDVS